MTEEYKKELKKEIGQILNNIETNYKFFEIYTDDLNFIHIVLKYYNSVFTLDINVSLKNVKSFYEEDGSTFNSTVLDFEDLNITLTIIKWWYN